MINPEVLLPDVPKKLPDVKFHLPQMQYNYVIGEKYYSHTPKPYSLNCPEHLDQDGFLMLIFCLIQYVLVLIGIHLHLKA